MTLPNIKKPVRYVVQLRNEFPRCVIFGRMGNTKVYFELRPLTNLENEGDHYRKVELDDAEKFKTTFEAILEQDKQKKTLHVLLQHGRTPRDHSTVFQEMFTALHEFQEQNHSPYSKVDLQILGTARSVPQVALYKSLVHNYLRSSYASPLVNAPIKPLSVKELGAKFKNPALG